jgi:hypothetical protein
MMCLKPDDVADAVVAVVVVVDEPVVVFDVIVVFAAAVVAVVVVTVPVVVLTVVVFDCETTFGIVADSRATTTKSQVVLFDIFDNCRKIWFLQKVLTKLIRSIARKFDTLIQLKFLTILISILFNPHPF